jgi:hypothetical protein
MGTRSTIAIEFADQSVSQIYCHWDGYLDNNGRILQTSYMDPFKVRALVDLGGFSSLRDTVEETAEGAYTQRGEELSVNRYKDTDEYFDCCQQEEYDYILRNVNGVATWFVRCYATNGVWTTLDEAEALQAKMEKEGAW